MRLFKTLSKCKTIVLLCCALFSFSTQAQVKTLKEGTLIVGMTGEQPPFNFVTESEEMMGYDMDTAHYLAKQMNLTLDVVVMPFKKLTEALQKGHVDIVMSGMAVTTKREQDFLFSTPYALAGKSIVTTKKNLKRIYKTTGFNDSSIKLTALAGSTSYELGKTRLQKAQLSTVKHYEDGLLNVLSGKADGLIADLAICELMVFRDTTGALTLLKRPIGVEKIAVVLPKGSTELQKEINLHLLNLTDNGGIKALHQKWFIEGDWLALLPDV